MTNQPSSPESPGAVSFAHELQLLVTRVLTLRQMKVLNFTAALPWNVVSNSIGVFSRTPPTICQLICLHSVHRSSLKSYGSFRKVAAFHTDTSGTGQESVVLTPKLKRKVAMHVAYCGTGYQGDPTPGLNPPG